LNVTVGRYGGNSTSRYNWQISATNLGHDWYFMNVPRDDDPGTLPHGSQTDKFVEQNIGTQTDTIMTVPMMGWVAKDREVLCAFSVEKYGVQEDSEYWHPDCGNGVLIEKNGGDGYIRNADPSDTNLAIDETFIIDWIDHLTSKYGPADDGGVKFYSMDNEPMLWSHNHRDAHPEHTTYAEVRDKTYQNASAVKQADPAAQVLGPAVWGWPAYFHSQADLHSPEGNADRMSHGDTPFLEWYLQQMATYELENGTRILDYLDLHYYPQAENVTLKPAGDLATQQRRLRTTRSLWDPNYGDESWILEPVYLLPRMHSWVNRNYPETKLSISEYNFGGLEHINGAVTQADVLGIFGRENLHMATLWGWLDIDADQPWAYAFRMYRNYDGQKSEFGDLNLLAVSENEWDISVFASKRSSDGALTIMVVNKRFEASEINLRLDHISSADFAEMYQYSGDNLSEIKSLGTQRVFENQISTILPSQSITLFVLENIDYVEPVPEATPTPIATPTPVSVEDPIQDAPINPTPATDPEVRHMIRHNQSSQVTYEWLNVEVPANTFSEDVYFEIEFDQANRSPKRALEDLLLSDGAVQFELNAFKMADAQTIQLNNGKEVTVELELGDDSALLLESQQIVLLQKNQFTNVWDLIPFERIDGTPSAITFSADQLTAWSLQTGVRSIYLPLINR
ncbi:MAG: glycoside hydrolase family 44 protein, partial [Chloroflexota bacterium]